MDRTTYPDAGAARQEDNQKETATDNGEDAVMTSSSERRRRDDLLTNWRKEMTFVQHSTYIIVMLEKSLVDCLLSLAQISAAITKGSILSSHDGSVRKPRKTVLGLLTAAERQLFTFCSEP